MLPGPRARAAAGARSRIRPGAGPRPRSGPRGRRRILCLGHFGNRVFFKTIRGEKKKRRVQGRERERHRESSVTSGGFILTVIFI